MTDAPLAMGRKLLIAGGLLSSLAALLHIAIIFGGADWYRFFGAGEDMARMAEKGWLYPKLMTIGISAMLFIWAWTAFAGAGLVRKPPLLRTGLVIISSVYLLRGLILFPMLIFMPDDVSNFVVWSSLIVLVYGLCYTVGTWRAWPNLS